MSCPDCERYRAQGRKFCGTCGRDLSLPEGDNCDRCAADRARGFNYCTSCGARLSGNARVTSLICPDCEGFRQDGCRFCGTCGSYLIPDQTRKAKTNDSRLLVPAVVFTAILAVIELLFAWRSVPYVLSTDVGTDLLLITPMPRLLVTLTGAVQSAWYIIICAVLTLCAVICFKKYVEARGRGIGRLDTSMFAIPAVMGMTLLLEFLIIIVSIAFGATPSTPMDVDKTLIPVAVNASVWEEIITRVLLIGLPMLVLMLLVNRGDLDLPWYRYLLGGFGYSRIAMLLVIISSVFFGIGHIGWGIWKVLPMVIAGLAMGYLYMKYGLHASILMHMLTDLSLLPTFYGMEWLSLMIYGVVVLALPAFVIYGRRLAQAYRDGDL